MWGDERAIAFGIIIMAALLIVGTIAFLAYTPVINLFIEMFNEQVLAGDVSKQRGDSAGWAFTLYRTIPIWLVLGATAWGIVRALEQKNQEGT